MAVKKLYLLGLFLVWVSVRVFALDCPSCGMSMIWTGQSGTEWGKLVKLYRCPAGHQYWITSEQEQEDRERRFGFSYGYDSNKDFSQSYSYGQVKCPLCGSSMIWTGRTKSEWGRLLKIYRCPAGHEAVAE